MYNFISDTVNCHNIHKRGFFVHRERFCHTKRLVRCNLGPLGRENSSSFNETSNGVHKQSGNNIYAKTKNKAELQIKSHQRSILGVAGVGDVVGRAELLLDRTQADEARKQVSTARLVVGARGTRASEGLLSDDGAGALAVEVEVTGRVAQGVVGQTEHLAVPGEDGTRQTVITGLVDLLADLGEVGVGGILVGVDHEDRTEQLAGEERVVGVGGAVDGRLDVPALGGVVGASSHEFQLGVVLGLINDLGQLVERGLVDDGAAEVGEVGRLTNLELVGLGRDVFEELLGDRVGHVRAGGGTALLALEFKGTADGLDDGVTDICRLVDEMEVLSTGLTNDARVAAVLAIGDAVGDLSIEAAEDPGATGEVKSSEIGVVEHGVGDFFGLAGNELDDILGEAGLKEDLVDQPVGGNGRRRRLPDDNVAHQGGSTSQVTTDGREVERTDGVDESLQRAVFHAATSVSFFRSGMEFRALLTSRRQGHDALAAARTGPRHT